MLVDGYGGFGDQFERYAHLLNIARLLKATAVTTFTNSGQVGSHEYIKLARVMNINMDLQNEYTKYNISQNFSFRSLDEVMKIHTEIQLNGGSSPRLPCHSVVHVNMYDCSGTWCSFMLKEIHEVKWILKNNSFVSYCAKNKLGFKRERGKVNVLWHVRNGDLCIRCKDPRYFDPLLQLIRTAMQSKAQAVSVLARDCLIVAVLCALFKMLNTCIIHFIYESVFLPSCCTSRARRT